MFLIAVEMFELLVWLIAYVFQIILERVIHIQAMLIKKFDTYNVYHRFVSTQRSDARSLLSFVSFYIRWDCTLSFRTPISNPLSSFNNRNSYMSRVCAKFSFLQNHDGRRCNLIAVQYVIC